MLALWKIVLFIVLPFKLLVLFENALAEVACRQHAARIDTLDQNGRAGRGQSLVRRMTLNALPVPFVDFFDLFRVGEFRLPRSAYSHGLEVFGAHDAAHSRAAVEVLHIVADVGEANQTLTAGADTGNAHPGLPCFFFDFFKGLIIVQPPDAGGVAQTGLAVHDAQIDGLFGFTANDDGVIAGEFEFGTKIAARFGLAEAVGQGGTSPPR